MLYKSKQPLNIYRNVVHATNTVHRPTRLKISYILAYNPSRNTITHDICSVMADGNNSLCRLIQSWVSVSHYTVNLLTITCIYTNQAWIEAQLSKIRWMRWRERIVYYKVNVITDVVLTSRCTFFLLFIFS